MAFRDRNFQNSVYFLKKSKKALQKITFWAHKKAAAFLGQTTKNVISTFAQTPENDIKIYFWAKQVCSPNVTDKWKNGLNKYFLPIFFPLWIFYVQICITLLPNGLLRLTKQNEFNLPSTLHFINKLLTYLHQNLRLWSQVEKFEILVRHACLTKKEQNLSERL